ncbi:hypothetical protein SEA_UTZCHIPS_57 [Microbacterium phage UtzChips]|nr:hypothetical protein SEA_UTZCHIPS_57 [Microbacterium phage UtzChips]
MPTMTTEPRPSSPTSDAPIFATPDVDYAAILAARHYPADIRDGVDLNGSARAAYARGYTDGLEAATP